MRWTRDQIFFVLDGDQTEDPVATVEVLTPDGLLMIMGEPRQEGRSLIVAGVHMHGVGIDPNGVTAVNLRVVVEAFLEVMDYDDILVEGAVRTSGANPGRRPRPIRFTRRYRPAPVAEPR